ncbi:MAG TPA: folylpolyglutamate synthase/dihydrofolate synthase family protein [Nitriliruptorales bacterium]|nr:folylpolyglutamate synthase/dihydrofolate synthase family protein [Nitriliruptorales bacterium]
MTHVVTYDDALRDLESRVPSRMVPDLRRITALADLLGNPQRGYPSIHITGTNGKTSVARMVTALLGALRIRAGTYTSPHLQSVRERIRVAGQPISQEDFAQVHAGLAPLAAIVDGSQEAHSERVTYFEVLTAMAYWWFADHPVDVGVFEVGMGGTWDATNLVRGEVAVVTPVAVDHPELGATPAEVAVEKAGIIKSEATVVLAEQSPDVLAVIEARAAREHARVVRAGAEVALEERHLAVGGQVLTLRAGTRTYTDVFVPLHGAHQADNAVLALGALSAFLGGLEAVDDQVVREGFAAIEVPGRLEVVHRDPTVLLDGAHNPAGAVRTAEAIEEAFDFRDLIMVVGCLADKDVAGILRAFRALPSHVVVTRPPSPRAAALDRLESTARQVWSGTGVAVERAGAVEEALDKAIGVAGRLDAVVVTGSLYLVGAARQCYLPVDP